MFAPKKKHQKKSIAHGAGGIAPMNAGHMVEIKS